MVDLTFYSNRAMRAARSSADAVSPSASVSSILMPSNPYGVNLDTVNESAESSLKSKRDCASPYVHEQRKKCQPTIIYGWKFPIAKGKKESVLEIHYTQMQSIC